MENTAWEDRKEIPLGASSRRSIILLSMILLGMTLAVYWQVRSHEFIDFDDTIYVTQNPHVTTGLTIANIIWALTSVDVTYWSPITFLSHMTDVQLFGMDPRYHHITSITIHSFSTVLLFLLLCHLTRSRWQSFFIAALFALHPLHVESVAWVAERKDVLSAFFWFLTLGVYAVYVGKRKPLLYCLTLIFFVLGLMSKPMVITLPLVMLLMDFWPLNRYKYLQQNGERPLPGELLPQLMPYLKEKIPFFACSIVSGVVTIYGQHKVGAVVSIEQLPISYRIGNALIAYLKYLGKTVWPQDLAVFYPLPPTIPLWEVICSLLVLLIVSVTTIRAGRRYPYLPVGWFWYLITLLPVIGFTQAGSQAMADRFTYIPHIGLFIIAAAGISDLTRRLHYRRGILTLICGTVLLASAALTWQQLGYWRDNISLYRHSLNVTAGSFLIHYNLGIALANKMDLDAAINEYKKALRIRPNYPEAHVSLGLAFANKLDLTAAINEYHEALRIDPNNAKAQECLGYILAAL